MKELTFDEAEAIIDNGNYFAMYEGDEHRWSRDVWYVLQGENGSFQQFCWDRPLTEMQEGWDDASEVFPLVGVRPVPKTVITWERT